MTSIRSFRELQQALAAERAALVDHPLYASLTTLADVRTFMEHHVFAVWDFMSLLKTLQRALTCVEAPWTPRGHGLGRRLVNEIVLGEESDESSTGGFELYRAAMLEVGADTSKIDALVDRIRDREPIGSALRDSNAPLPAREFVLATFATIRSRSITGIAAAFTLGREDIIPDMFVRLVDDLSRNPGVRLALLRDYLVRHIHIDSERHGPMSARLLESLCGEDERAWRETYQCACDALVARRKFWNAILARVGSPAGLATEGAG